MRTTLLPRPLALVTLLTTALFFTPSQVPLARAGVGCPATPIGDGVTINGSITATDCASIEYPSNRADYYSFSGVEGDRADLLVTEAGFNTVLVLYSPTGNRIAYDNNSGGGDRAWLSIELPATGTFTVEVTPYFNPDVGNYSLRFRYRCAPTPIQDGETVNGELTRDDCMSIYYPGNYADSYSFAGTEGERVDVLVTEASFNTFLALYSPTENPIANDNNTGGNDRAWLSFKLPTTGIYRLEVTSYFNPEFGGYTIRFQSPCTPQALARGQVVNGSLGVADCMSYRYPGNYADFFTFAGKAGQQARITVAESNFNTYLVLYSPTGNPIAEDNNSGGGDRARIEKTLTADGVYTLEMTSYFNREPGNYTFGLEGAGSDPDFAIRLGTQRIEVSPGTTGMLTVFVDRIGFTGQVTITSPDSREAGMKLKPPQKSTSSDSVDIRFKVKRNAPIGTHEVAIAGTDASGRRRTAALELEVVP